MQNPQATKRIIANSIAELMIKQAYNTGSKSIYDRNYLLFSSHFHAIYITCIIYYLQERPWVRRETVVEFCLENLRNKHSLEDLG